MIYYYIYATKKWTIKHARRTISQYPIYKKIDINETLQQQKSKIEWTVGCLISWLLVGS